jgi:hypothetical protein
MDKQTIDSDGDIVLTERRTLISSRMQKWAGIETIIIGLRKDYYELNGIPGLWEDLMFEPVHSPAVPLNPIEAVERMVKGEPSYTEDGGRVLWDGNVNNFLGLQAGDINNDSLSIFNGSFEHLYENLPHLEVLKKRDMTRWEVLAWATSEISHGWVVVNDSKAPADSDYWVSPQYFNYYGSITNYKRAMLKPDCTGVDESSIQTFEVVEE